MTRAVAIVGAGPAGCFLAQALLKAQSDLRVDLIDALPVPYGLVRYGVAADHQGTKAIQRQFARLFERQGARFFGNVTLGQDITLDDLRGAYDAVVLATGLHRDRRLGIPGDYLDGIHGAGRITRALYEHPDAEPLPDLGPRPLIVGNGNVAIDLLRLLAKSPEEFDGTDLGDRPSRWLAEAGIEEITILGRSPAAEARFDPVMVKELGKLGAATVEMDPVGEGEGRLLDALRALDGHGTGPRRIRFRFSHMPVKVEGAERVEALVCRTPSSPEVRLPATSIITAIGFEDAGGLDRKAVLAGETPGLYATGWFARGPRGTIPENRADAQALAARILEDLETLPKVEDADLFKGREGVVDYAGWSRIDAAETAQPPAGRVRTKIADREGLIAAARAPDTEETS